MQMRMPLINSSGIACVERRRSEKVSKPLEAAEGVAWRRRKDHRPQEILAAARRLIEEEGAAATSMARIAKLAGVSEATVYKYYESKQDLVNQVLTEWAQPFVERLASELRHISGLQPAADADRDALHALDGGNPQAPPRLLSGTALVELSRHAAPPAQPRVRPVGGDDDRCGDQGGRDPRECRSGDAARHAVRRARAYRDPHELRRQGDRRRRGGLEPMSI